MSHVVLPITSTTPTTLADACSSNIPGFRLLLSQRALPLAYPFAGWALIRSLPSTRTHDTLRTQFSSPTWNASLATSTFFRLSITTPRAFRHCVPNSPRPKQPPRPRKLFSVRLGQRATPSPPPWSKRRLLWSTISVPRPPSLQRRPPPLFGWPRSTTQRFAPIMPWRDMYLHRTSDQINVPPDSKPIASRSYLINPALVAQV